MDAKYKISYNVVKSRDNVGYVTWFFLIVESPEEIESCKAKLYDAFKPIKDMKEIERKLDDIKLNYLLVSFDSEKGLLSLDMKKIYDGIWKRDSELNERARRNSLEDIISKRFEEKTKS